VAWYGSRLLKLMSLCALGALLAAGVVWLAERGVPSSPYHTYSGTIRQIAVLLFSGWDVDAPATPTGFWGAFMALLFGLVFVATMTAEVAAVWVEQRLNRSGEVHTVKGSGHVILCNASPHLRMVVEQLLHPECCCDKPVVVLAEECPPDIVALSRVLYVKGDPTEDEALLRAGVERAKAAIILATDLADPASSDSRAVLTALAVEALNPDVYTVVEIVDRAHAKHLAHARVDEVVTSSELGAKLAVQATIHPGLARFVDNLLTFDEKGEFYTAALPAELAGLTAGEAAQRLHGDHGCILLGIVRDNDMHILFSAGERLAEGDTILFLALEPPAFLSGR